MADEVRDIKADNRPDEILAYIYALQATDGQHRLALDLQRWFIIHHPEHPYSKAGLAEDALRHNNWAECAALLEDLMEQDLYDGLACHIRHLFGLACLGLGDPGKAKAVWQNGLTYEAGTCEFLPLIKYAEQVLAFMENKGAITPVELPGTLHLWLRIDDALEREDWLSVIEALEPYALHSIGEVQLLARFTEAFLHLKTDTDTGRRLGKMMVLSSFCHKCLLEDTYESGALLAPLISNWSESRLDELTERAEEWLAASAER